MSTQGQTPVIQMDNIAVSYWTRRGEIKAVRDVSFAVHRGETFGIVGESGSGKSTVAFSIVNFLGPSGRIMNGKMQFQGRDMSAYSQSELDKLRGDQIAMVYQDPSQALNPSMRIGNQLTEVLEIHRNMPRSAAHGKCVEMLARVQVPDPAAVMNRYPHQLSGGQQQRVVIAMALLSDPSLLILDEPTTALDVTVEATVLDLVDELRQELNMAVIYITHDLGVVARVCDTVGVMYAGEMVERAGVNEVFARPRHPYTLGLLRCVPRLGHNKASSYLQPIEGHVPAPNGRPPGCGFAPRCAYAEDRCRQEHPNLDEWGNGHLARCFLADQVLQTAEQQPPLPMARANGSNGDRAQNAPDVVLRVDGLKTYYKQEGNALFGRGRTHYVKAVEDVSFEVSRGATLGIVGESGCGKSTLAKTIVGLENPTSGRMDLMGVDITAPVWGRSFDLIQQMQMVFQNPDSTLNPSFSVGYQIGRALKKFRIVPGSQVKDEVIRLLEACKLNASYYDRLPHQLSGGEKQRIAVARAIAAHPEVLLCDEPLSALDVSVQAAIINLLAELQREHNLTILFIAHDLSVVRFLSDYVAVMYLGTICEIGPAQEVYQPPYHPYTEALLSAVPIADPRVEQKRIRLSGAVPSALHPPTGCPFHTRCPHKIGAICEQEVPPMQQAGDGHFIHCHIPLQELQGMEAVIRTPEAPAAPSAPQAEGGAP